MSLAIFGWDTGLVPNRPQSILHLILAHYQHDLINNLQWDLDQNIVIFYQENALKMACAQKYFFPRGYWVKAVQLQQLSMYIVSTNFTKLLWFHNPNLGNICAAIIWKYWDQIRSQFCTCHDSWAVVTCANMCPECVVKIVIKAKSFHKISVMNS